MKAPRIEPANHQLTKPTSKHEPGKFSVFADKLKGIVVDHAKPVASK